MHGERVRHRETGDLGVVVEKEGELYVQHLRAGSRDVRYREDRWAPTADEFREINPAQRARIVWHADQAYCQVMGLYGELNRVGWESLEPEDRKRWQNPDNPPIESPERWRAARFLHRGLMPKPEAANG